MRVSRLRSRGWGSPVGLIAWGVITLGHDELADLVAHEASCLDVELSVGDEHVDAFEGSDGRQPDDAPLRVVGDDDDLASGSDEKTVRLGLEQVRRREARVEVDAVDPEDERVDVDVCLLYTSPSPRD